jgi:hypothetical protein
MATPEEAASGSSLVILGECRGPRQKWRGSPAVEKFARTHPFTAGSAES